MNAQNDPPKAYTPPPVVSPSTGTPRMESLLRELEQLTDRYGLPSVLEQLAVACEIRAATTAAHRKVEARELQQIGLDLMTLSERVHTP
jgi:hypothetical protein